MKQFLPSVIAVLLSLVLCSFNYAVKETEEEEVLLYWHPVDSSTGFVYALPSGPAFKSSMVGGSCEDEDIPICYYGSDIYEDLRNVYVGDVTDAFRLVKESY